MDSSIEPAVPVIVMARSPLPGRCKTRLIPALGARGAARLYGQLVRRSVALALEADCGPVILALTPTTAHPFYARYRALPGARLCRQPRGDLGQRMSGLMDAALRDGASAVLLIGSDAANLEALDLREAAARLRAEADVVLQPSDDGGYVLIGARCKLGSALRGVRWSSGRELAQTRTRLQRRCGRLAVTRMRADIDTPADLRRARRQGWM